MIRAARCGMLAGAASLLGTGCVSTVNPQPLLKPVPATAAVEAPLPVEVRVDERVELIAIIFRLAGADEYSSRYLPVYAEAIDKHFAAFRNHPAVAAAKQLRAKSNIGWNAIPDLAVQLTPLPELSERVPLEQAELDERWKDDEARAFVAAARDFARASNAAVFFEQQQPLIAVAERRLRNLIDNEADLRWIQKFYGGSGKERFFAVPTLSNGNFAYGVRYFGPAGEREFYSMMLVGHDEDGLPVLAINSVGLLVHEFGHSYVTPLILSNYDRDLKGTGDALLEAFGDEMGPLGYTKGSTIIHESIIRAGVARYKLAHLGEAAARRELKRQVDLGFIWVDDLYALLGTYENSRARYPDIAAFYPTLRDYFQGLTARLPAMKEARDALRPKIVDASPKNGAVNVNPATTKLVVRFDRPMRQSWGWKPPSGDMGAWPELSDPSFDASRTVLTATIKLKPNTAYEATFLTSQFGGADGIAMAPYTLKFRTGRRR